MTSISRPDAIAFDCYGTLIDWSTGILDAFAPFRDRIGIDSDQALLARYAEHERQIQSGAYRPYKTVLRDAFRAIVSDASDAETNALPDSIARWEPFPDTADALGRLARACRLTIISNIDDDLVAHTLAKLPNCFEHVVTAEQVGSYKPGHAHFREVRERLGLGPARILCAAESRFHDIAPARSLGFRTVWVNRAGPSTSGAGHAIPDHEFASLSGLADALGL